MDSGAYEFKRTTSDIHDSARVSCEATLVGDVWVGADASVWPGVVLRGDVGPVRVGRESHIGDTAVLHASTVGDRAMVGHGAVLNDAVVEDGALVGFNIESNNIGVLFDFRIERDDFNDEFVYCLDHSSDPTLPASRYYSS